MYDSREHTMAVIARTVGVSRATLYRYLGDDQFAAASQVFSGWTVDVFSR
jgi:AcrR family transcriptional regulator